MHFIVILTTFLWTTTAYGSSYQRFQTPISSFADYCDCNGTRFGTKEADGTDIFLCNDARLGPIHLPTKFPLASIASNYDRFGTGNMTPGEFLAKYWDPTARDPETNKSKPSWIYPKNQGFQLDVDGIPIRRTMILKPPLRVDRFGGEGGNFIAAADAPFAQRALPPSSLNTCPNANLSKCNETSMRDYPYNYHLYEVIKEFEVVGGPVASGFGQSGLGAQFYIGNVLNVSDLVEKKYLKRLNLTEEELGPGSTTSKCGKTPVNCTCHELPNVQRRRIGAIGDYRTMMTQ